MSRSLSQQLGVIERLQAELATLKSIAKSEATRSKSSQKPNNVSISISAEDLENLTKLKVIMLKERMLTISNSALIRAALRAMTTLPKATVLAHYNEEPIEVVDEISIYALLDDTEIINSISRKFGMFNNRSLISRTALKCAIACQENFIAAYKKMKTLANEGRKAR